MASIDPDLDASDPNLNLTPQAGLAELPSYQDLAAASRFNTGNLQQSPQIAYQNDDRDDLRVRDALNGYTQQQGQFSFQGGNGDGDGVTSSPAPIRQPSRVKSYKCAFPGCEKTFSRAEHLNRHATNHDNGGKGSWVCPRPGCGTLFKRKDLLERHNIRHRQKDEEAGGEGLGILQTRKRLWKDDRGAVIEGPRPEHAKRHRSSASRSSLSSNQEVYSAFNPGQIPNQLMSSAGYRNLNSTSSSAYEQQQHGYQPYNAVQSGMWPGEQHEQRDLRNHDVLQPENVNFLFNAAWGTDTQDATIDPLLYGNGFVPDTASSFNNPFTTEIYYSWLFDEQRAESFDVDTAITNAPNGSMSSAQQSTTPSSSSANTSQSYHGSSPTMTQLPAPQRRQSSIVDAQSPELSAANQILAMSKGALNLVAASLGYANSPSSEHNVSDSSGSFDQSMKNYEQSTKDSTIPKRRQLPFVNDAARQGILDFIDRAAFPQGAQITREHPLLSLGALQEFCNLYFIRFNTSYPLLHQATFDPAQVDPLLLLAVVLLGATYSNKEAHLFSIFVHDTMRAQIMNHNHFTPRPVLWMLQTILLVECFGKSRAGQLQHDMSHLFHGLLINLIRRSDCQSARCPPDDSRTNYEQWLAEVDAEQRRRLALFCFMWDTQHAVLFSQSLCMNAAELKLTLPWDDNLWEADSAEEFFSLAKSSPKTYLSTLKSYITPSQKSPILSLNLLSHVFMLHGLMSVAWDLNRRDQTSMSFSMPTKDPWRTILARAYEVWYDAFANSPYTPSTMTSTNTTSTIAIYHAAHIALHVEITDLQIFAGATHIIGRPVTALDITHSGSRIQAWVSAPYGADALRHAARILRDGMHKLQNWDADDVFHYPWCLYLATLVLWSFQVSCKAELRSGDNHQQESENEGARDEFDAKAEMMALISQLTRSGPLADEDIRDLVTKFRVLDVPRIMAGVLGRVRWAVVQEGAFVLRGLRTTVGGNRGGR